MEKTLLDGTIITRSSGQLTQPSFALLSRARHDTRTRGRQKNLSNAKNLNMKGQQPSEAGYSRPSKLTPPWFLRLNRKRKF